MLSAFSGGMHRHTRPAAYADKKQRKRAVKASRPGSYGFSFTGEFPEAPGFQPVEATERRRRYAVANGQTSSYQAVGSSDTVRIPTFNRYGVRLGAGAAMLIVLAVLLAGFVVYQYAENTRVAKMLSEQVTRMDTLAAEANTTLNAITLQSMGVNIRQEATRIGLRSSRGVEVEYLDVPADAVFGPGAVNNTQDMASVWGQ